MWLSSLRRLVKQLSLPPAHGHQPRRARRAPSPPRLERLEDRTLLSAGDLLLPKVTTDFLGISSGSNTTDVASAVAIYKNPSSPLFGKIVVVGSTDLGNPGSLFPAVARYNDDGTPDPTFGGLRHFPAPKLRYDDLAGTVTSYWPSVQVKAVALQPADDKIVVVGYETVFIPYSPYTIQEFALLRYNADGTPDTTFGPDHTGLVTTDLGIDAGASSQALAVAVQPADGKIVVAGDTTNNVNWPGTLLALARYNVNVLGQIDGTLDTTFTGDSGILGDGGGKFHTFFGAGDSDVPAGVVIQPADNKIVVAETSLAATPYPPGPTDRNEDFGLVRYNTDGTLDTPFGGSGTGRVTTNFGVSFTFNGPTGSADRVSALALQPDGKFVMAGTTGAPFGGTAQTALARYKDNGDLDGGFGTNGLVTTVSLGTPGLALQTDGKMVLAGATQSYGPFSPPPDFAVARLTTNGALDTDPTTGFGRLSTSPPPPFGSGLPARSGIADPTDFAGGPDTAFGVAIQADGTIVAVGMASPGLSPSSSPDFALARYDGGAPTPPAPPSAPMLVWNGQGDANITNNRWSDGANWVGGVAPHGGETLVFPVDGSVDGTSFFNYNDLDADPSPFGFQPMTFHSITFGSGFTGYTIGGNEIILTTGITDNSAVGNTINMPIQLGADQTWTTSFSLIVGGDVKTNGHTLTVDAVNNSGGGAFLSGVISGSGALTKNGPGQLSLAGANTYEGTTTVMAGLLIAQNDKALGTPTSGQATLTRVMNAATLALAVPPSLFGPPPVGAGITIVAENLEIDGTGVQASSPSGDPFPSGALLNNSGINTWGNTITPTSITLTAPSTISGGVSSPFGPPSVLTVNSTIDNKGFDLTATGTGGLNFGGIVTGSGRLLKTGTGTLALFGTADNDYTGATEISQGIVVVAKSSALGTTGGDTTVASGAALLIQQLGFGPPLSFAGHLTLNGTGIAGTGSLRSLSSATWSGDITLQSDTIVDVEGGGLILSGVVGESSPGTQLTKIGSGWLILGGDSANTYTGTTTLVDGTLELNKVGPGGVGRNAVGGDVIVGDGTFGFFGADQLLLSNDEQILDTATVTVNSSGKFDFNGKTETIGALIVNGGNVDPPTGGSLTVSSLAMTGGSIDTGTGTLNLNGDVTTNASATSATISGKVNLGLATRTFTIADGAAPDDMVISAVISGADNTVGLTLAGTGKLKLTGNNTYAGTTTVNGGVLEAAADALSATAVEMTFAGTLQVDSPGATIGSLNGAGTVKLDGTLTTGGNDASTFFSGRITGAGGLTKVGAGSLGFTGSTSNDYTGVTRVNAGSLSLAMNGVAIAGDLVIGDDLRGTLADFVSVHDFDNQIAPTAAVTINSSGSMQLGTSQTIRALTMVIGPTFSADVHTAFAGVLTLGGDVTVNVLPGTTAATPPARIQGSLNLGTATRTFTIADGAAADDMVISATISGTGGLTKEGAGKLVLSGNSSYTGTTTINAGVLSVRGAQPYSPVVVNAGGTLGGTGTTGTVDNTHGGKVAPGDSPGALTVVGDYTQANGGILNIEIGGRVAGTEYDQLNVTGVATLGGILNVSFINGFVPGPGDSFQFLTFGSVQGDFAVKNGLDLGNGKQLTLVIGPNGYTLNAPVTASISGPSDGVRGQPRTFILGASGATGSFTYGIDWDGNGTVDQTVAGPDGTPIDHVFTTSGSYTTRVTATGGNGTASPVATHAVAITDFALQADPSDPAKTMLVIGGSLGDDVIRITTGDDSDDIKVKINEKEFHVKLREVFHLPIDRILVYAQDGDDTVTVADSISIPAMLDGGAGNDHLQGGGGDDVLLGGEGDDELVGGAGNNRLDGGAGNNKIRADGGNDTVTAGDGNNDIHAGRGQDTLVVGNGNNTIGTDGGNDVITVGNGNNTIHAGVGNNTVTAGNGNNTIQADGGDDVIAVGNGSNTIHAGAGNNTVTAGNGNNAVDTGSGTDTITVGDGNNEIHAGAGDDIITAGNGCNTIDGGAGNDVITIVSAPTGTFGNDWIDGGAGNDMVFGGKGNDTISGSAGDDVLIGGNGDDVMAGGEGRDLLIGGMGGDQITGDAGDDILIAGSTAFDSPVNVAALQQIMAEWTSGHSYADRVANLLGISAGRTAAYNARLNGSTVLIGDHLADALGHLQTVFGDTSADSLTGKAGSDWFLANITQDSGGGGAGDVKDVITDLAKGETASDIDA